MNRQNAIVAILTLLLAGIIAAVTASSSVSEVRTKTLRNEQDIRELRTETRDILRELQIEGKNQRDLILDVKRAIEVHAARDRRER